VGHLMKKPLSSFFLIYFMHLPSALLLTYSAAAYLLPSSVSMSVPINPLFHSIFTFISSPTSWLQTTSLLTYFFTLQKLYFCCL
jgi:hypothetical protein